MGVPIWKVLFFFLVNAYTLCCKQYYCSAEIMCIFLRFSGFHVFWRWRFKKWSLIKHLHAKWTQVSFGSVSWWILSKWELPNTVKDEDELPHEILLFCHRSASPDCMFIGPMHCVIAVLVVCINNPQLLKVAPSTVRYLQQLLHSVGMPMISWDMEFSMSRKVSNELSQFLSSGLCLSLVVLFSYSIFLCPFLSLSSCWWVIARVFYSLFIYLSQPRY